MGVTEIFPIDTEKERERLEEELLELKRKIKEWEWNDIEEMKKMSMNAKFIENTLELKYR